jgi:apolipoprotein N-acyltransferase
MVALAGASDEVSGRAASAANAASAAAPERMAGAGPDTAKPGDGTARATAMATTGEVLTTRREHPAAAGDGTRTSGHDTAVPGEYPARARQHDDMPGGPGPGAGAGLPTSLALLVALAGGAALAAAFPPVGAWPLAAAGPALLVVALWRRSLRGSLAVGLVFGLAFFVPLLSWLVNVAWYAWAALAGVEAAIFAVLVTGQRLLLRLRVWPVAVAGWWVAAEAVRARWPYAFPWGRLAMSQASAPTARWSAIGGAPLLTFVVALAGACVAWLLLALWPRVVLPRAGQLATDRPGTDRGGPEHADTDDVGTDHAGTEHADTEHAGTEHAGTDHAGTDHADTERPGPNRPGAARARTARRTGGRRVALPALAVAAAAGLGLGGRLLPVDRATPGEPSTTVAAVQGNVPHAQNLPGQLRAATVTQNHAAATDRLAALVRSGSRPAPAVVIWPENSTDLDPRLNPATYATIQGAVDAIRRPVLVGAVLQNPVRNAGQLWLPGRGPAAVYIKRQLVPFGEYIPFRGLLSHVTSLTALQPVDFTPGHRAVVFRLGKIRLGDVICYEVGFDNLVASEVTAGANLLAVQSNDADFELDGQLGESAQQIAMARIRAIESNRAVVYASTTGESAIIAPDGSLIAHSGTWQRAVLDARVPLRSGFTLADRVGGWPEYIITFLVLVALAWAAGGGAIRRARARGSEPAGR